MAEITVARDQTTPFFSVILCTYNRGPLLSRALDSLLAQEEPSWEALVVDDGSEDDTADVVRGYTDRSPKIRYLRHRNRGLFASRNLGVQAAVGRYVTFLDSDDRYLPNHLAVRRRVLEENPGADLLHGGVEVVGDPYVPDRRDPSQRIHLDECAVGATFVIRPRVLLDLGGFPRVPYAGDRMLFDKIVEAGLDRLEVTERTYVYDRTTPDSMCSREPSRRTQRVSP